MKNLRKLMAVTFLMLFFITVGCGDKKETVETPPAVEVQKPTPKAEVPTKKVPANEPTQYLNACLKDHPERDRKYCECFSEQMEKHVKVGATEAQKGRAAGMAAMSCRNVK